MFKKSDRPGFTLVETVISIAVISIITALFIANYRSASRRSDIIMRAQEIVADIHLAQNNALGLVQYNNSVPPGGWGINFNRLENSYTIFADLNAPGTSGYGSYDSSSEGNQNHGARTVVLPPLIKIFELKTADNATYDTLDVTFLPPDPKTNIWQGSGLGAATSTALEITLTEEINNSTKTIRLNFLGLAEVLD